MPPVLEQSADSKNKYEDLSGVDTSAASNPYDALIQACEDDSLKIQTLYSQHRTRRNAQQKEKFLDPKLPDLILDGMLEKLENPSIEPGYVDPRHCLVFWARPPQRVRDMIEEVQKKLKVLAPRLWIMPPTRLHLTALEVTHSLTEPEIEDIINTMKPVIPSMCNYMQDPTHRARLIKPFISYDTAALALSFLPASGELPRPDRTAKQDSYSYHHLRRDLFDLATKPSEAGGKQYDGVTISSRYVVPSAHLTIGRFVTQGDHGTLEARAEFVALIDEINEWLVETYWPRDENGDGNEKLGFEWIVGEGKGLDLRKGTLWYGGGETVLLGGGF